MDCNDAGVRLKDLVAGRLPSGERKAIEEHLRRCPVCAAAAVSLAHPAEERALWEHVGRAAARPVRLVRAKPKRLTRAARSPVVLRRAHPPKKEKTRVPLHVRFLQTAVIGLAASVFSVCAANFGNWNEFFGLDRWTDLPVYSAAFSARMTAPVVQEPTVFREASETLTEIASVADGLGLSRRIRSSGVIARLRVERRRPNAPAWIRSTGAAVEALLVRAEAAGSDAAEWRMVQFHMAENDLIRVCSDLDAAARLLGEGDRP